MPPPAGLVARVSPASSVRVTIGAGLAFFVLGLLVASYGPLLPGVRDQFDLTAARGGLLLSAHFAGSVAGVLLAGAAARRTPARWRLLVAAAVLAVGITGAALAPSWPSLLVAVTVAGLGWGGLELDVNVLLSRSHGPRSGAVLNALSAAFGAGAVAAPVLVAAGAGRQAVFLMIAALCVVMLPLLAAAPPATPAAPSRRSAGTAGRGGAVLQAGFVLLLLFYVGAESGVAGWAPTHLAETAAAGTGGTSTTAFWVCFTLGRLLAAPISLRLKPASLLPGTLLLACAVLTVAHVRPAAPSAYAAAGLFLAPVFPTALAWWSTSASADAGRTAVVIAASSFGPVLMSPGIGAVYDALGPGAIPTALVTITLLTVAVALRLRSRYLVPGRGGQ